MQWPQSPVAEYLNHLGCFWTTLIFETEIRNRIEIDLGISPQTLAAVYDGMSAVVNEPGGTAYKEFANSGLAQQDVKVYGKTGSTEKPDNAWFAGFAADSADRKIAIAVLVEGGQHGSSDAAPLARDIIQFCIDAGYIGKHHRQSNNASILKAIADRHQANKMKHK